MTQQINQFFDYAKQFSDNAFKAQTLALKGLQTVAELQFKELQRRLARPPISLRPCRKPVTSTACAACGKRAPA
jgi:hypothetical protein